MSARFASAGAAGVIAGGRAAPATPDVKSGAALPGPSRRPASSDGRSLPAITHWTAERKEAVLLSIALGELTDALAHSLYGIGAEELAAWRRDHRRGGRKALAALRVTGAGAA